ncbi:MAG: hypothetical protein D6814_03895 [Calditrichaeota bacterium]|nr:MAG: hypothetical protein D6814_03895 [Calditrichota bacterium]
MIKRTKQTLQSGLMGGLAGYITERGLESAFGIDFINGVLEIAGATMGIALANRDIVENLYYAIKDMTGKEPVKLSDEEWEAVRAKYPRAVEYLEKALAVQ